jgi:hypothetical protein
VGRPVFSGDFDSTKGARIFAESALYTLIRGNGNTPFRDARKLPQNYAIGTYKAAIWPAYEHTYEQKACSEYQHVKASTQAEKGNEGIIPAYNKCTAGGSKQNRGGQINISKQA